MLSRARRVSSYPAHTHHMRFIHMHELNPESPRATFHPHPPAATTTTNMTTDHHADNTTTAAAATTTTNNNTPHDHHIHPRVCLV